MFLTKVKQSYCYTKLSNYRNEYVLKPISNIPNILVCCNQVSLGSFKWMDNLQQIEHHQKIKKCLLFFVFNFTCSKIFAFKENHYSISTPTTLRVFLMGRSGYTTKQGNWVVEGSPCKSESLNVPLLLDKNITYWEIPHFGKKGISNSFQISFNKYFACSVHSVTQL